MIEHYLHVILRIVLRQDAAETIFQRWVSAAKTKDHGGSRHFTWRRRFLRGPVQANELKCPEQLADHCRSENGKTDRNGQNHVGSVTAKNRKYTSLSSYGSKPASRYNFRAGSFRSS